MSKSINMDDTLVESILIIKVNFLFLLRMFSRWSDSRTTLSSHHPHRESFITRLIVMIWGWDFGETRVPILQERSGSRYHTWGRLVSTKPQPTEKGTTITRTHRLFVLVFHWIGNVESSLYCLTRKKRSKPSF